MRELIFISMLALCLGTGCSTMKQDFMADDLRQNRGVQTPIYEEGVIEKIFSKKVNLPRPFTVAVYFKTTNSDNQWRWTLADKRRVIAQLRENLSADIVSKIFLINDLVDSSNDISNIRLAAAQYHADSVFVVDGIAKVTKTPNRWGTSYLLIAPTLFVNGTTAKSFFAIKATLWDVRNELLYLSLNGEGELIKKYPMAWGDDDSVYYEKTKQAALLDLESSIQEDLKTLK